MLTNDRIEATSRLLALLTEFAKLTSIALLAGCAVAAVLFPKAVKGRLDELGLQINVIDVAGVKIVAKETVKANSNGFDAAEALTTAEIKLTSLSQTGSALSDNTDGNRAINEALMTIRSARNSLSKQAEAIKEAGRVAGLSSEFPSSAWVYVGYYGDDSKLRRASDRVRVTPEIARSGAQFKEVVLDFDAPVATTTVNCIKRDIADVPMPDPPGESEHAIVTASDAPLKVLETRPCAAVGNGQTIFARIEVPAARVKFAKLSQLVRM